MSFILVQFLFVIVMLASLDGAALYEEYFYEQPQVMDYNRESGYRSSQVNHLPVPGITLQSKRRQRGSNNEVMAIIQRFEQLCGHAAGKCLIEEPLAKRALYNRLQSMASDGLIQEPSAKRTIYNELQSLPSARWNEPPLAQETYYKRDQDVTTEVQSQTQKRKDIQTNHKTNGTNYEPTTTSKPRIMDVDFIIEWPRNSQ